MRKCERIIAIDPGKSGGIAVLNIKTGKVVTKKMPVTVTDILKLLRVWGKDAVCFIEKVHSMPRDSAKGAFTFGKNVGHLEGILAATKIPTHEVSPKKWQATLELGTKGKRSDKDWKNHLKAKAQKLYPDVSVYLWNSDALLLLTYGEQQK